jgi:ABC-type xylose transport system permease subunit
MFSLYGLASAVTLQKIIWANKDTLSEFKDPLMAVGLLIMIGFIAFGYDWLSKNRPSLDKRSLKKLLRRMPVLAWLALGMINALGACGLWPDDKNKGD